MSSLYPSAYDVLSNPLSVNSLASPSHAGQHANANDAIKAIETELGTNPQGSDGTLRARLDRMGQINPATGAGLITLDNTSTTAAATGNHTHTLSKISNVLLNNLQDRDILVWDSSLSVWRNAPTVPPTATPAVPLGVAVTFGASQVTDFNTRITSDSTLLTEFASTVSRVLDEKPSVGANNTISDPVVSVGNGIYPSSFASAGVDYFAKRAALAGVKVGHYFNGGNSQQTDGTMAGRIEAAFPNAIQWWAPTTMKLAAPISAVDGTSLGSPISVTLGPTSRTKYALGLFPSSGYPLAPSTIDPNNRGLKPFFAGLVDRSVVANDVRHPPNGSPMSATRFDDNWVQHFDGVVVNATFAELFPSGNVSWGGLLVNTQFPADDHAASVTGTSRKYPISAFVPTAPTGNLDADISALDLSSIIDDLNTAVAKDCTIVVHFNWGGCWDIASRFQRRNLPQWAYNLLNNGGSDCSAAMTAPNTGDDYWDVTLSYAGTRTTAAVCSTTGTSPNVTASAPAAFNSGCINCTVTGTGVTAGTTILSYIDDQHIVLSAPATIPSGTALTIGPARVTGSDGIRYSATGSTPAAGGTDPGLANKSANPTNWQTVDPSTLSFARPGAAWNGVSTSLQSGPIPWWLATPGTVFAKGVGASGPSNLYSYTPNFDSGMHDYASLYGWINYVIARAKVTLSPDNVWRAGDTTAGGVGIPVGGTVYTLDECPRISAVLFAGTMTVFDEPMQRSVAPGTGAVTSQDRRSIRNAANLVAAWDTANGTSGSTPAGIVDALQTADIEVFNACMSAHAVAWTKTPSAVFCNPYQRVDRTFTGVSATSRNWMDYWIAVLGTRAALGMAHASSSSPSFSAGDAAPSDNSTARTDWDIGQRIRAGAYGLFQTNAGAVTEVALASAVANMRVAYGATTSFFLEATNAAIHDVTGSPADIAGLDDQIHSAFSCGPLAVGNVIDLAVSEWRTWNSTLTDRTPMHIMVRLFGGWQCPPWWKNYAGTIPWIPPDKQSAGTTTIPKWWTANDLTAFTACMTALAAKYDSYPEIVAFTFSGAHSQNYSEPYLRQWGVVPTNQTSALAAGLTGAVDAQSILDHARAQLNAFTYTRTVIAFNPWQPIEGGTDDTVVPLAHMATLVAEQGTKVVLSNDSARTGLFRGGLHKVLYDQMASYATTAGIPVHFQTATGNVLSGTSPINDSSSWVSTLDACIASQARSIEPPDDFYVQSTANIITLVCTATSGTLAFPSSVCRLGNGQPVVCSGAVTGTRWITNATTTTAQLASSLRNALNSVAITGFSGTVNLDVRSTPFTDDATNSGPTTLLTMKRALLHQRDTEHSTSTANYHGFIRIGDEVIRMPRTPGITLSVSAGNDVAAIGTGGEYAVRGVGNTTATTHLTGDVVWVPVYCAGSPGLDGTPGRADSTIALRYVLSRYDPDTAKIHARALLRSQWSGAPAALDDAAWTGKAITGPADVEYVTAVRPDLTAIDPSLFGSADAQGNDLVGVTLFARDPGTNTRYATNTEMADDRLQLNQRMADEWIARNWHPDEWWAINCSPFVGRYTDVMRGLGNLGTPITHGVMEYAFQTAGAALTLSQTMIFDACTSNLGLLVWLKSTGGSLGQWASTAAYNREGFGRFLLAWRGSVSQGVMIDTGLPTGTQRIRKTPTQDGIINAWQYHNYGPAIAPATPTDLPDYTGSAQPITGVYIRTFQNGAVVVNTTTSLQTVSLPSDGRTYTILGDDGSGVVVTSVAVPKRDAVFLSA